MRSLMLKSYYWAGAVLLKLTAGGLAISASLVTEKLGLVVKPMLPAKRLPGNLRIAKL
jgi:hypothetical protein